MIHVVGTDSNSISRRVVSYLHIVTIIPGQSTSHPRKNNNKAKLTSFKDFEEGWSSIER